MSSSICYCRGEAGLLRLLLSGQAPASVFGVNERPIVLLVLFCVMTRDQMSIPERDWGYGGLVICGSYLTAQDLRLRDLAFVRTSHSCLNRTHGKSICTLQDLHAIQRLKRSIFPGCQMPVGFAFGCLAARVLGSQDPPETRRQGESQTRPSFPRCINERVRTRWKPASPGDSGCHMRAG